MDYSSSPGSSPPGSSPPEIRGEPEQTQQVWGDFVKRLGQSNLTTWTYQEAKPWEVGWAEALGYARDHYEYVSNRPGAWTGNDSCLAAALVSVYREQQPDGKMSHAKSLVTIASIPRGNTSDNTSGYGQLADPNTANPRWKNVCFHWGRRGQGKGKRQDCATTFHAEDLAIHMMFNKRDEWRNEGKLIHWLDTNMLVYGVRAGNREHTPRPPPSQQWPCGDIPYHAKFPRCQDVLERLGIEWRFGIIPAIGLPQYPPGWWDGEGQGGNGDNGSDSDDSGGGGHHHRASELEGGTSYGNWPTSSTSKQSSHGATEQTSHSTTNQTSHAVGRRTRHVGASRVDQAGTRKILGHPTPPQESAHNSAPLDRHNTRAQSANIASSQLSTKHTSLSSSLAKMSLGGKNYQQPMTTTAGAAHVRRVVNATTVDTHPQHNTAPRKDIPRAIPMGPASSKKPHATNPQPLARPSQVKTVNQKGAAPKSHVRHVDRRNVQAAGQTTAMTSQR